MVSFATSYTEPTYNSVNFTLCEGYIVPSYNEINFTLSDDESCNTCVCAGFNKDWEVKMSDYCVITDNCDLGTGQLKFEGEGNFSCDAEIKTSDMEEPGSSGIFYVDDNCSLLIS